MSLPVLKEVWGNVKKVWSGPWTEMPEDVYIPVTRKIEHPIQREIRNAVRDPLRFTLWDDYFRERRNS